MSEFSDEIRAHLEEKAEELMARGMPREDAWHAARREFGNLTHAEERSREVWRWSLLDDAVADVRYALRQLAKAPGFTVAAVATLALGIGANTAMYSVIDAALVRPLEFSEPERLLMLWTGEAGDVWSYSFSYPRFRLFEERARGFADVAVYDDEVVTVTGAGSPERLTGGRVSANFFAVLGVSPVLGRGFREEEDRHGAPAVALISHEYWQRRYHGDAGVLGRGLRVDAEEAVIIGVLPAGFRLRTEAIDIWRTRMIDTRTFAPESVRLGAQYLIAIARLRPGVTPAQARSKLSAIDAQYKKDNAGNSDVTQRIQAEPLEQEMYVNARTPLLVLWGAVGGLLLLACANVANLVLARSLARHREIALRMALGAPGSRIVCQLITEGVLLAALGGVAALPVAWWSLAALAAMVRETISSIPEPHLNAPVLASAFALAAAIGVAFGLSPAWWLLRSKPEHALRTSGRSVTAGGWSIRAREAIVALEVALSMAMLAAGALLAQSFVRMTSMETGVHTSGVVHVPLDLMPDLYQAPEARGRFYDEVLRRASALPGVRSAAVSSRVDLLQHGLGYMIRLEGRPDLGPRNPGSRGRSVSPAYFDTLGIRLLRGRVFSERDSVNAPRVVIVNEAFAKLHYPGVDAVGRHVVYSTDRVDCEIVGVVRDVRASLAETGAEPTMYLPLAQRPWLVAHLLIRPSGPPVAAETIRKQVQAADPEQAVGQPRLLDDMLADRLGQPRTTMSAVAAFALVALLLAGIGIYGVSAYAVTQRSREIGIRITLGAGQEQVRALVFRRTLAVLLVGLAAGVPLAIAMGRLYAGLLFGVRPAEPVTLAAVAGLLGLMAVGASWAPAARAARIDPALSLRAE